MKNVYETLLEQEKVSIVKRKKDLENEIAIFKEKERKLQRRYKRYKERLSKLEQEAGLAEEMNNNGFHSL